MSDKKSSTSPQVIPGNQGPEEVAGWMQGGGFGWSRQKAMQHGEVLKTTYNNENAILLTGENGMKAFYNNDWVARKTAKSPESLAFISDGKSKVVPALDGEEHRERKAILGKLIQPAAFKAYLPVFDEVFKAFVTRWESAGELDLKAEAPGMVFQALSLVITGMQATPEMGRAYNECMAGFRGIEPEQKLPYRDQMLKWYREGLAIQKKKKPAEAANCMLGILAHNSNLTDDEIVAEIQHIFIGSAGVWVVGLNSLARLAEFPEVLKEVRAQLKEFDTVPTLEQMDKAAYLQAFIEEVMRTSPIINAQVGRASKDFVVNGYTIAKGTLLVGGFYATNHLPSLHPEPDSFNPKRCQEWAAILGKEKEGCPFSKTRPHAFVAFGGGDRMQGHRCLGEQVLYMAVKLLLARSLKGYKFTLVNAPEVKQAPSPYMAPQVKIRLEKA